MITVTTGILTEALRIYRDDPTIDIEKYILDMNDRMKEETRKNNKYIKNKKLIQITYNKKIET